MYLILFDPQLIRNPNRYYNLIIGECYTKTLQTVPDISVLNKNTNVDEILIYSGMKEDEEKPAKIARCSAIEHGEGFLRIEYGEVKSADATCKDVKGRVYHYCMQHDLLTESKYSPCIIIIDNMQHYTDIKMGRLTPRYVSIMSQLDEYQKKGDWLSVIKLFPDEKNIKNSDYWDDVRCLSKLAFALSKLAIRYRKTKSLKSERNTEYNYDKFFLLVSDRCLELNPEASMHTSTRAYYYYDRYMTEKKDDFYIKAYELYESLVSSSAEWYKEKYRFVKLRHIHFESNQWNGRYSDIWLPTSRGILKDYKELIEVYNELDEFRKKQYHKLYLKALFGYAIFSIDNYFTYWDDYVKLHIFDQAIKAYKLKDQQLKEIVQVEEYLKRLYSEKHFDDLSLIDLQDKPNYFEVQYRIAQLEQIKGIVYVMKGKEYSEFFHFFKESNERLNILLSYAKAQKEKNEKFNYPHYAKLPKAINLYFIGEYDECHRCFYRAREYMLYEEGCIYALCKDYSNAIKVLSTIPEQDKCYNKAKNLLSNIRSHEN